MKHLNAMQRKANIWEVTFRKKRAKKNSFKLFKAVFSTTKKKVSFKELWLVMLDSVHKTANTYLQIGVLRQT